MLDTLHFQDPLWFVALLPLALLLWFLKFGQSGSTSWAKIIDANLLPLLLQGENKNNGKFTKWLIALAWLISIVALADPVWEKIPKPVFKTNSARIIVFDLSNSMLVNDLKPSRLARARFKIEDILSSEEEGQFGLVVFAGDAFTASPLTRDADTIRSLLQVLKPQIMPSQGSRVDLGLTKALELLTQANVKNGQVLLISDGVSKTDLAVAIATKLKNEGHEVSVLGVGTEKGGMLRYSRDQVVTVKLEQDSLREIARYGNGRYHQITGNNNDLKAVISSLDGNAAAISNDDAKSETKNKLDDVEANDWRSTGPYLVLLLLPFAALAFRKGWLFSMLLAFCFLSFTQTQPAMALSLDDEWNSLWKTDEQRADIAFQNQQYGKASELAKNPLRRGSAAYKKGDYEAALESFQKSKGADARYNEGNAFAKLKKYQDALNAYEKALTEQPNLKDALLNKKAIENFLKQQKKHKSDQSKNDKSDSKKESKANQKSDRNGNPQQSKQNSEQKGEKKDAQENKKNNKDKNQFSDASKALDNEKDKPKENKEGVDSKNKEGDENKPEDSKKEDQKLAEDQSSKNNNDKKSEELKGTKADAEKLSKEEKMAAEQWLRRIPDDPGGLLRRKFLSQYRHRVQQERRRSGSRGTEKPW